ncbi:MAG: EamA family transporter [Caulobacteraceae bacterium]|nr:EamA family transporter [Caulobacteraceae bacterium]
MTGPAATPLSSWQAWALLSAGFAALTAVFAKIGVSGVDPDLATFIRVLVILPMLALVLWATGQYHSLGAITPRTWVWLAASGLATGASWICYFRALRLGPAAQVAPVDKLSIVFVAALAAIFLGERLSPLAWTGVALMGLGAILVARF